MDKAVECVSTSKQKYLKLLGEKFPTTQSVFTEIINLEAILNLPAATEHFMSDVHGEYEAFVHILNNCSGAIREQITKLFSAELDKQELADFCTLIYYSQEKLRRLHGAGDITSEWYLRTLKRLIVLARTLASNYTQSKVRKAMPVEYAYIIDELLHASAEDEQRRQDYHARIFQSIVDTGAADDFIVSLSSLIKRLAVDHLHLVGDIFDRGPHADRILDHLMSYQSLDVQWGNHDIVWMGAAAGSSLCQIAVIRTNIHYNSLDMLESAYGISLRELENFARRNYTTYDNLTPLYKAISVILFKLEGQAIARHPNWKTTAKRRLLDKIDVTHAVVTIDGYKYPLRTRDFPTVDFTGDPFALSKEEQDIVDKLANAFSQSDRLRRHVGFLYETGSIYLVHNGNLLFHGCLPLTPEGKFAHVACDDGVKRSGKDYLDFCDRIARRAWKTGEQEALDWMYYLWCGAHSPLSGRVVKTFERTFVEDEGCWKESNDPYFSLTQDPAICDAILQEFGLGPEGHIINGHTPVKVRAGQSPVRAGGKLLVIDGGFAQAYHARTGIAGYTLVQSAHHLRIKAHRPFRNLDAALDTNADIMSETDVLERYDIPHLVGDTDKGIELREQIADLNELLRCYRSGELAEG